MSVRAKFRVNSYESTLSNNIELRSVKMSVVYEGSDENKQFFKFTPNGMIQIGLLGPETWSQFILGTEVYVDFTVATPPDSAKEISG